MKGRVGGGAAVRILEFESIEMVPWDITLNVTAYRALSLFSHSRCGREELWSPLSHHCDEDEDDDDDDDDTNHLPRTKKEEDPSTESDHFATLNQQMTARSVHPYS